jgi:hypothetical protein
MAQNSLWLKSFFSIAFQFHLLTLFYIIEVEENGQKFKALQFELKMYKN